MRRSRGERDRSEDQALDQATFQRLRYRITDASGIFVPDDENSRFILERRLISRLRLRGLSSFEVYESSLDDPEMEEILDAVAVHETYFFREQQQLKIFSEQILPELIGARMPLKIWSAGCSTGEEAYTIEMLLAEQGLLDHGLVSLTASDLSRRVVESGVRGVYSQSSFRTTDPIFREKYFVLESQGAWRVREELRALIKFEQFNLMQLNSHGWEATPPGGFDLIFCRNVLMYFDETAVKRSLASLHSMLAEGGYLLLGHAESLMPLGTGFKPVQFGRELVHKK
ncbi:MAG TPA: protein-glutamate O-methyltransferase CheR [Blastocatellia bacterium]|nr:protein-glutamate O-methyltransferase CheR [Blastocatellia bacterium]